jgi:hypothetical protein
MGTGQQVALTAPTMPTSLASQTGLPPPVWLELDKIVAKGPVAGYPERVVAWSNEQAGDTEEAESVKGESP